MLAYIQVYKYLSEKKNTHLEYKIGHNLLFHLNTVFIFTYGVLVSILVCMNIHLWHNQPYIPPNILINPEKDYSFQWVQEPESTGREEK